MISLADAIIRENVDAVRLALRQGAEINELDEYGFRPLIEAAIVDNLPISQFLLSQGANPCLQDMTGGTALHWAADNNHEAFCDLLLKAKANPNAYNFAGQPVLAMPMLRQQKALVRFLIEHGADEKFARDYINTKLIGHVFELIGSTNILSPDKAWVEISFEGFFLEVTLGLVADSLRQFQNHYAARQLRRYERITSVIVGALDRALQLMKYSHYRQDIRKVDHEIENLIMGDPLIIPVGYEGHAITFIRYGQFWVKCDRREDSRLYDNVAIYQLGQPERLTVDFIKQLIYTKQSSEFINHQLDEWLQLSPLTTIQVEAQKSGNCSWANVEASIPALFFLIASAALKEGRPVSYYKSLALHFFHRWREWNKDRALTLCIQSYEDSDAVRKASKAEVLAAILFHESADEDGNQARFHRILDILKKSRYQYLIQHYLRIYSYDRPTKEGEQFVRRLKMSGFLQ